MSDTYDLVVVGAGASGLLAAVAARRLGLAVLVAECEELAGGATAMSSGTIWLPGNALGRPGVADSPAEALRYLDAILGPPTLASSEERRAAYAATAGPLAQWLIASNLPLTTLRDVPDHHPTAEGGKTQGRVLGVAPVRRRPRRGSWADRLRAPEVDHRRGRALVTRGEALSAELLHRALANGVELWFGCPLVELVEADGRIVGVVVRRDGVDTEVTATRGVILATGGFAGNQKMREEYLPLPTDAAWTLHEFAASGQTLALAMTHGAAVAAMDDAWWVPVILADGRAHRIDVARRAPHGIIVDQAGDRFFDEDAAPTSAVRRFYERRTVRAVPSYLVMDDRHRRSVDLGPWKAGTTPKSAVESGQIVRADSLTDLASALGVDRAGLLGSVVRFNGFAIKGKDLDFHRGESAWGRFGLAPSKKRRNPGLGKLSKSPFWAVAVYPGDEGTKGGLLIDKNSRVLRDDGEPIEGLYACGGTAASIMTRTSPGPGAALGEALIEAYRAVQDLTRWP